MTKKTYWKHSMSKFLKTRGVDLAITAIAVTALMAEPAWSGDPPPVPGPAVGIIAGAAIIGALVIAKLWRRK